jgi:hypothetical protein
MTVRHRPRVVERVEHRIDDHTRSEHPRAFSSSDAPESSIEQMALEQAEESEASYGGFGVVTRAQVRGALWGLLVGGLIGGLIAWPFGFIGWGAGVALGWRILLCAVVGIVAGATVGAVYWGSRLPELSGEMTRPDNLPSAASSLSDPDTDARGR